MAKKKKKENYLDYIPVISPRHTWDIDDKGIVTIHMVHRGFYAGIAQKFFNRPRVSHITLERTGSFLYPLMDGKRTVYDLSVLLKEEFGDAAEPLYERLVKYMKILHNNGFIYYAGKDKIPK